jgi:L,D-peptidoglycan transpeptidase YkuD (ErfK/YbiS/YcfS/YnhG family)
VRVRRLVIAATVAAVVAPASAAQAQRVAAPAGSSEQVGSSLASAGSSLPTRLRGVHHAKQLVVVTAPDNRTTYATLRAYRHSHGSWHRVAGPWTARLGWNGFARRGHKREGDGQTPTGSWRFRFAYGVDPDPGTHLRYRRSHSSSLWDDDSTTSHYNRWVDSSCGCAGSSPEHMQLLPQYRYGVIVSYNWDQTPYAGSAIFLHVTDGTSTAGCIAIGRHQMVHVLRWLRPRLHPRIIMGRPAAITS